MSKTTVELKAMPDLENLSQEDASILSTPKAKVTSNTAWIIWACAAVFYLYEMILRVSTGVMTEELMHDFGVTSTALGVLASLYYWSYTALQIPCGVIVDWLGVRRVVTTSAALCTLGSVLFAQSDSLLMAQAGRFLIGAGSACAFLSCLKVAADWFSPGKFALLAGLTNMMGTLGGTFGGRPFAVLVDAYGWRSSMMFAAAVGVVVTLGAWVLIKDRHPHDLRDHELKHTGSLQTYTLWESVRMLATSSQVWLIAIFGGLMYVPISAFTELWAVPYLMQIYGIDNKLASTASVMLFIGMAIGAPLAAWLSDYWKSRIRAMEGAALGMLIIFLAIVFVPGIPLALMFVLLFIAGVFNGGQVLCFACIKEISPHRISGTTVGFTNTVVMMSGVVFQPFLGMLLDFAWEGQYAADGVRLYSDFTYQMAMIAVPVCLGISWILLKFSKETYREHLA